MISKEILTFHISYQNKNITTLIREYQTHSFQMTIQNVSNLFKIIKDDLQYFIELLIPNSREKHRCENLYDGCN
jgi:hypothetical protein